MEQFTINDLPCTKCFKPRAVSFPAPSRKSFIWAVRRMMNTYVCADCEKGKALVLADSNEKKIHQIQKKAMDPFKWRGKQPFVQMLTSSGVFHTLLPREKPESFLSFADRIGEALDGFLQDGDEVFIEWEECGWRLFEFRVFEAIRQSAAFSSRWYKGRQLASFEAEVTD